MGVREFADDTLCEGLDTSATPPSTSMHIAYASHRVLAHVVLKRRYVNRALLWLAERHVRPHWTQRNLTLLPIETQQQCLERRWSGASETTDIIE